MPIGYDKPHSWLREDADFDRYNKPGSSSWFDLSDDVSFDKPNNRHDALKVESLLGYGGYMDLDRSGGPLGLSRGTLEKPIKAFQARNGLEVDGWLKPGGPTIKKMQQLYGNAFGATPAPTPAMMDAHVEKRDAGEDGFLHDEAPKFGVKPNRRLDAKAPLMDYERWNRDWARGSGNDPKGLAREYEGYIRDLDKDHGHDPGLIFARDLTQQVEKYHGKGSDLAKQFVTLLADRPDLQRQYLGGEVPKAPPMGTFKPGGEDGVKQWIDQDRIANGLAPRYAAPAVARGAEKVTEQRVSSRGVPVPEAHNLFDFAQEMQGLPEQEARTSVQTNAAPAEDKPMTRADLSPTAEAIQQGRENSRREPGVQIAMAPGAIPPLFAFEPRSPFDVTKFDGPFSNTRTIAAPIPPPPRPAPLRMPEVVDPTSLSDADFEDAVATASERGAQAGQEVLTTQSEVDRLNTMLREHQETFRQQIQIGIAEGTGEASQTLPAEAPENREPAGRAAARAVERHAGDAAFQGGAEALGLYIRTKHRLEEQLAAAEVLAKRGSEVADAYRHWSRALANDRLRRWPGAPTP